MSAVRFARQAMMKQGTEGSTIKEGGRAFLCSPKDSWTLGKIVKANDKPKGTWSCKSDNGELLDKLYPGEIFAFNDDKIENEDVDDLLHLLTLHDATLMNTSPRVTVLPPSSASHPLCRWYFKDIIYTNIGAIAVAFNPFNFQAFSHHTIHRCAIPWYTKDNIHKYLNEGHVVKHNIPHSWAVAHNTFWEMMDTSQ
eukprot:gene10790-1961_t